MAERRMFAKTIIDSDAFLEMPQSSQNLYFHLSMRADDEGFINNPLSIMKTTGCKQDDLGILISKKFIIPFESGIVVIKHWRIHNYIQSDRFKETKYKNERELLTLDENGAYRLPKSGEETRCIQNVYKVDTQVRLGKDRLGKVNEGSSRFTPPTIDELCNYIKENRYENVDPQRFMDHYISVGWKVNRNPMKDWKAAVRQWDAREKEFKPRKSQRINEPVPEYKQTTPPLTEAEIEELKKRFSKLGGNKVE